MIYLLGTYEHALVAFIGVLFAFAVTCIAIAKLNGYLPKDMGRQYAHDGALSAGKPRGAGIIFVLTFVVSALLFGKMNKEIIIYLVLIVIEMFTGFFDDAAEKPWGEYLKGILDLAVAVVVAISYLHYNSSEITICHYGNDHRDSTGCICHSDRYSGVGFHQCYQLFGWCGWIVGNTDHYHVDECVCS